MALGLLAFFHVTLKQLLHFLREQNSSGWSITVKWREPEKFALLKKLFPFFAY